MCNSLHCFPLRSDSGAALGVGSVLVTLLCPDCQTLLVFHLAVKVCSFDLCVLCINCKLQLSAMDVLARIPMKGAAKCDEHCELQNSENQ